MNGDSRPRHIFSFDISYLVLISIQRVRRKRSSARSQPQSSADWMGKMRTRMQHRGEGNEVDNGKGRLR